VLATNTILAQLSQFVEFGIVRTSLSLYSYFSKYHFKYHRREQYELIHCQFST
jgi:hypothetical protein